MDAGNGATIEEAGRLLHAVFASGAVVNDEGGQGAENAQQRGEDTFG
jgi:hypothetical protein